MSKTAQTQYRGYTQHTQEPSSQHSAMGGMNQQSLEAIHISVCPQPIPEKHLTVLKRERKGDKHRPGLEFYQQCDPSASWPIMAILSKLIPIKPHTFWIQSGSMSQAPFSFQQPSLSRATLSVHSFQVMSDSLRPSELQPTKLLCPWDSPGKNNGVGSRPSPEGLPNPETELRSPEMQADSLPSEPPGKPSFFLQ